VLALASPVAAQEAEPAEMDQAIAVPAPEAPRPWFVSVGVGAAVRLDATRPAAARFVEEAGLHFDGTPVGPFLALLLAEDASNYYSMQIGLRLGWDLEILRRDFSIVVSPSLGAAFAFDTEPGYAYGLVQPALGVGLLLLSRMLAIWVRPVGVDIYLGQRVSAGWAAVAGATIAF